MDEKYKNYFIIERIDNEKESDNLKNIYDLSILDKVKKVKYNNKIKKIRKVSQHQKLKIIQAVKKAILSTNLTYRWKLESFKQILFFFHIFMCVSALTSFFKDPRQDSLLSIFFNNFNLYNKAKYNISYNLNETINNFTNDTEKYWSNSSDYNTTNINHKKFNKNVILIAAIFNQIMIIPIWFVFFYRFIPKWEKVNDILYKITNYLLYCESVKKGKYVYQLMKNYSILVVKKKFIKEFNKLPNELKNQSLLPLNMIHNDVNINKNIFSYCISIINDFVLEDFAIVNYQKLIPNEDSVDINILIKYMESSLHEKIKKYIKTILLPLSLLIFISIYNNKNSNIYFILSNIFICINLLIGKYIFKEYYRSYKKNIDNFIDNFNVILIQKNRFIYRKDRLILFFALKNNHYSKIEIINAIKKIIS